jgi:AI-2 transport protein TqsA
MFPADSSRIERSLFIIALIFIIVVAVKMTAYIVTLFAMALILTLLFLPAMLWLKEKGLSDFSAVSIITVLACLAVLAVIFLTFISFNTLLTDLPMYQKDLNLRLADATAMLNHLGISSSAVNSPPDIKLNDVVTYGITGAMSLMDAVMFLFFVGVITFFMLLDAPLVTAKMEEKFGKDSGMMRRLNRMTGYVIDFIIVRTEVNAIHGVLFGGFLAVIGVHGAILWGVLTFLLGYIPFIGLIIAAIPAIFFAWLQYGVPGAVAVIVAILILNLVVENPVYSFLAARRFEMPALIVILSLVFWGWLLGLVGMLFSIPLTLLLLLLFQVNDDLRWINELLGIDHLFEDVKCRPKAGEGQEK